MRRFEMSRSNQLIATMKVMLPLLVVGAFHALSILMRDACGAGGPC
jgi:hypothetical protein